MSKISTKIKATLFLTLAGLTLAAQAQLLPIHVGRYYPEAYDNYFSGNYFKSCKHTGFDPRSGIMHSECLDKNQNYKNTQMYVSHRCKYIENLNGNLVCTQYKSFEPSARTYRPRFITREINAGPIWNNADAPGKCQIACGKNYARWDGNWHTIINGQNSVCDCKIPHYWKTKLTSYNQFDNGYNQHLS